MSKPPVIYIEKARRYVDNPSEVPEGYEIQEGPKGGIYYETEETEQEAGAGGYDRDELDELVNDSDYVVTENVSNEDLRSRFLSPFIVDVGDGPQIVQKPSIVPIDDEGNETAIFDSIEGDVLLDEINVLGRVKPKRDEHGHLINPTTAEVEKPQPNPDFNRKALNAHDTDSNQYVTGDWWNDRDVAQQVFEATHARLRAAYGKGRESAADDVWAIFESWRQKGYDAKSELWEAAMAMTEKEEIPEHLTNYKNHGIGDTDPEVLQAICDVIRMSRETVREEFGDTVKVYRAISGETFRQYSKKTEDGVEIKPNVMESWSIDPEGAREWAHFKADGSGKRFGDNNTGPDFVFIEKEFEAEDVAFHGAAAMGRTNATYKELTMAPQDETYAISEENIDRSNLLSEEELPDYMKQENEPPRMPWYASNWMFEVNKEELQEEYSEDIRDKIANSIASILKARRYVDDPSEVPEEFEVQEGPMGGIYYETEGESTEESEGEISAPKEVKEVFESAEKGKKREAVDKYFQDNFDIDIVVMPRIDDDEFFVKFSSQLASIGEMGYLDGIDWISDIPDHRKESVSEGNTLAGYYDFDKNRLHLSDDMGEWFFEKMDEELDEGETVGRDLEWFMIHEIGHYQHNKAVKEAEASINQIAESSLSITPSGGFDEEQIRMIADEVSEYGRKNPIEFVAEVFSGLCLGEQYSDRVMKLYDHFHGPDSWKEYREVHYE